MIFEIDITIGFFLLFNVIVTCYCVVVMWKCLASTFEYFAISIISCL